MSTTNTGAAASRSGGGKEEKWPAPRADHTTLIEYSVVQKTTASPEQIHSVVERFNRELKLQFGSSIVVAVSKMCEVP